jgi:hypothetical protein
MAQKSLRLAFLFCLMMALAPLAARAQQTLGSINGTVVDQSKAVVAGASVEARNVNTGLVVTAKTQNDGSYNIVDLPIGTYEVTITKEGFKKDVHSQILVRGNLTTTVNATLQPGEISTTVTVTATPLLNQTDTTNGYTLGSEVIRSAPLGTGSFTQLAILAPGVNADLLSGSGTNAGLGNQDIFANGQRDTSNSITFNAVNANNLFNGQTASSVGEARYVLNTNEQFLAGGQIQTNTSVYDAIGNGLPTPPPETIEEIHVNTSMYGASQGANSGAHVELTTKSGTNDFHGGAYEYHQTTGWNAAPFFFNAAGRDPTTGRPLLPRPPLHRNTFGGLIGGPIIRNKLFFFGSYQGIRVTDAFSGATVVDSVPAGLTNDRSEATLESLAGVAPGSADKVALAMLQAKTPSGQLLVPSANVVDAPGCGTGTNPPCESSILGGNAIEQGPPSTFRADQLNGNVDYDFSAKDRLSGKYYYQRNPSTSPFAVSQTLGFPQSLQAGSQVFSLDNTNSLTSTSTWEQRIGFIREIADATTGQQLTPSGAGINLLGSNFFPGFVIGNVFNGNELRIGPANNFANAGVFQNQFEGASNFDWIHGRHSMSFGFTYDYSQLNVINRENQVAIFNVTNFANFLTGTLGGRNGGTFLNGETNRYYHAQQAGLYVEDNLKVRSSIALDLGLRWDWDGPLVEKHGLLTNFYPSEYSYNLNSDTINNIGLVVAGNNKQLCGTQPSSFCVSNSTMTGRQWLVEPRIGLAWSPSFVKNVVVRTGFGLYADRGEFFTELSPSAGLGISGPFGVTTEEPFTVPFHNTCTGARCFQNNPFGTTPPPLPPNDLSGVTKLVHNQSGLSGCAEAPGTNAVIPTQYASLSCTPTSAPQFAFLFGGYDPRNALPYSENWTLDVQWQPYNTLLFDIGYVGNHGKNELMPIPFNQPKIATPTNPVQGQIYSYGYQATDADGGFGTLLPEQVATTIGEFTGADGNTALRVPFIGYNPNSDYWESVGISNYNALQFNVTKRMSQGLQVNGSYTWSHALDEGSGLAEGLFFNGNDPLNPRSAYGSAGFDRTHVFTVSYLYHIPNATKATTGWASQIANGWSISGITVAESGNPYSIYDFSGDTASQLYGAGDDFITNPLLSIINGSVKSVQLQGTTGVNAGKAVIDGTKFGVNVFLPGTNGVPPCGPTTDEAGATAACDFSETAFSTSAPRNPFRGPFQTRFDFGVTKEFKLTERFQLVYDAQFFNIFNHPSFDAPSNNFSLDPCFGPNNLTSPAFGCGWLGSTPGVFYPPTGTNQPIGNLTTSSGGGFIQGTLGSSRFIAMALHLNF